MKKLTLKTVDVNKLKPHPKNARIHDENNIKAIKESLQRFGQRTPIVVWKRGLVIKGCGTLQAIKELNWETVEAVFAYHLSESEALAYAIADNKTNDLSRFDEEMLSKLFTEDIADESLQISTGFNENEIQPLMLATLNDSPAGNFNLPENLNAGEFDNIDDTTGRIILVYDNEEQLQYFKNILGVDITKRKVVWSFDDLQDHKRKKKPIKKCIRKIKIRKRSN